MMDLTGKTTLLFDLDGTLIDSTADLAAAGNYIRQKRGMPEISEQTVAGFIGDGVKVLVQRLLDSEDDALVDSAVKDFIGHYHQHCLDRTRLYPGVAEALTSLKGDFSMAVVTNKPEKISAHIIEGLGLADCFGAVIGGNSGRSKKPDPEPLELACRRLGRELETAVMIGDSHVDIQAAKNAGIPSIGLKQGIGDAVKLVDSKPDFLVEDFVALEKMLEGIKSVRG